MSINKIITDIDILMNNIGEKLSEVNIQKSKRI